MKPFVWIAALILSLPFLAGAAFTGYDVIGRADVLTNPESKVAVSWLFGADVSRYQRAHGQTA
jgi:hypothetical protein